MALLYFADTSALLNGCSNEYTQLWISPLIVSELENIKTSISKNEHIKYLARQSVRDIIFSDHYKVFEPSQRKIESFIKHHQILSNINDHYILATAHLLRAHTNEDVTFITSDGSLYLLGKATSIPCIYYEPKIVTKQEYCGWKKFNPSEDELISLYSNPTKNILQANINEYCEIYEGEELKDVLRWDGEKYSNLKYQTFKGFLGEKVAPRNLEQKMLFNLLQNDEIKIKLCIGGFGDGKTWSMLQHALKGIKDGSFTKIIYVRNNIITKGSRDIGFLSGSLVDKIKPYILPIADLTTPEYLDEIIETGILEPVPLAFMRGRDFSGNILVFCDEAENLTKENIQLLIGRIGEGSQLWLSGDLKQIDHYDFEKNNGIKKMIDSLVGNKLFGMVKLIKSERSKTSQLADLMD